MRKGDAKGKWKTLTRAGVQIVFAVFFPADRINAGEVWPVGPEGSRKLILDLDFREPDEVALFPHMRINLIQEMPCRPHQKCLFLNQIFQANPGLVAPAQIIMLMVEPESSNPVRYEISNRVKKFWVARDFSRGGQSAAPSASPTTRRGFPPASPGFIKWQVRLAPDEQPARLRRRLTYTVRQTVHAHFRAHNAFRLLFIQIQCFSISRWPVRLALAFRKERRGLPPAKPSCDS